MIEVDPDMDTYGLDLQDKEGGIYLALQAPVDGISYTYEQSWEYDKAFLQDCQQIRSKSLPSRAKQFFVMCILERAE